MTNWNDIAVYVTCGIVFLSVVLWTYRRHAVGSRAVPIVPLATGFAPFFGHLLTGLRYQNLFHEWMSMNSKRRDSKPFHVSIPFVPPLICITHPSSLEHVLKTNFENYVKGPFSHNILADVLGDGIFNVDGDDWRIQRKTAAHIFNVRNFKDFIAKVFTDKMNALESKLLQCAQTNQLVDMHDLMHRFTFDGFMRIGFNVGMDSMNQDKPVPFSTAFDRIQRQMNERFLKPWWPVSEMFFNRQMGRDVVLVREFCMKIVNERRQKVNSNDESEENSYDLLSLFMNVKGEDGAPLFTDDELGYLVINFIVAGRDTTAQALSWTFHLLSKHPEYKATLLEEINSVLSEDQNRPSYDQVKDMKYAKAVFWEALRLYPSVPYNLKMAVNDDVLPEGTFVPAGAFVSWSSYAMGRSIQIWGDDADKFNPARWLKMKQQPTPFEFPAFNAGPRTCLGKTMAELEGIYILVSILRRFDVIFKNSDDVRYSFALTMPMATPLQCELVERK